MKKLFKIAVIFVITALLFITFGQSVLAKETTYEEEIQTYELDENSKRDWTYITDGYWTYIVEDGNASIVKYNGSDTNVEIPRNFGGLTVSVISLGAFKDNTTVEKVQLPNTLTVIGGDVFSGCTSLKQINIPNGVTYIGGDAFRNCTSLTTIDIADTVEEIANSAFEGCSSLISIRLPSNLIEVGSKAFKGCSSLTTITIPNGVTNIGMEAFSSCTKLQTISLPDSVTSMGSFISVGVVGAPDVEVFYSQTFKYCSALEMVKLPKNLTNIGIGMFEYCDALSAVTMPDNLAEIGNSAFAGCDSLTSLTIPASVTELGNNVFSGCTSLKNIEFMGNAPATTNETLGSGLPDDYWTIRQSTATGFTNPWRGYPAYEKGKEPGTETPPATEKTTIIEIIKPDSGLKPGPDATIGGAIKKTITELWAQRPNHPGKTMSEFIAMFDVPANQLELIEANGNPVSETDIMKTGMKLMLKNIAGNVTDECIVVVKGDLVGDGEAAILDYANHRKLTNKGDGFSELQKIAADLDNNGSIDIMDYAIMRKLFQGAI